MRAAVRALRLILALLPALLPGGAQPAGAQSPGGEKEPLGLMLDGYEYPHPVAYFPLKIEGQELRMAYLDLAAAPRKDLRAPPDPEAAQVPVRRSVELDKVR